MKEREKNPYTRESDLCADFVAHVGKSRPQPGWTVYPETGGFDLLLVRGDGVQIGIEAKLRLNVEVVCQALPERWNVGVLGPDYRAVLVPAEGVQSRLTEICDALGITVLTFRKSQERFSGAINPRLPDSHDVAGPTSHWHEWCPVHRLPLPDYVPDVGAGNPAPVKLGEWKIKAIKLQIILEHRNVTRADFKYLQMSPTRWLDRHHGWLEQDPAGGYRPKPTMIDFRAQHPVNYEQIKADYAKWARPGAGPHRSENSENQNQGDLL